METKMWRRDVFNESTSFDVIYIFNLYFCVIIFIINIAF